MATLEERIEAIEERVQGLQTIMAGLATASDVETLKNNQTIIVAAIGDTISDLYDDVRVVQDQFEAHLGQLSTLVPRTSSYTGSGLVTINHSLGYLPMVFAYNSEGAKQDFEIQHVTTNRFTILPTGGSGTIQYT